MSRPLPAWWWGWTAAVALLGLTYLPRPASAQEFAAVGAGMAFPTGGFGDRADSGYTARGRVGLSLAFAQLQLLGGWTRFAGRERIVDDVVEPAADLDLFHAGAGVRVALGALWLGANAVDFFGDGDEGIGFLPELGITVGPFEVVADYRVDGADNWVAVRAAIRF